MHRTYFTVILHMEETWLAWASVCSPKINAHFASLAGWRVSSKMFVSFRSSPTRVQWNAIHFCRNVQNKLPKIDMSNVCEPNHLTEGNTIFSRFCCAYFGRSDAHPSFIWRCFQAICNFSIMLLREGDEGSRCDERNYVSANKEKRMSCHTLRFLRTMFVGEIMDWCFLKLEWKTTGRASDRECIRRRSVKLM